LVAVAALALGLGATTTIFTVVNGVLLRPLPYRAANRLANIWNDLGEGAGMAQSRFSVILMTTFGGIALALAAIGIFGVISYSVAQRTREFGIRMALGERPYQTGLSVVLRGMRLVGISLGLGLLGALAASRLLAGLLYGVHAGDPLTFIAIAALLSLVALVACCLPARRAASVDPMVALRAE
jgi:putative ABC transport system permease protein